MKERSTIVIVFSTILLNLIVFFLPTQLGIHFWPDFSRAAGIKVDYLSPTLYFTDLLLISYIIASFSKLLTWSKKNIKVLLIFLLFISFNSIFGISTLNTLFWWLRLSLYLALFVAFRQNKITWSQIKNPLIVSTALVVVLQAIQTYLQHSLGGPLYLLGERTFNTSTTGLARMNLFGLDFVRSPATFSHPNSLSGYLLMVYCLLDFYKSPLWQRLIVFLGLILTFSKASLLAFLLTISFHINSVMLINLTIVFSFLQPFLPAIPSAVQFISDRLFLLLPAKNIIYGSSLLGVGLGNFIPALVSYIPGSFLIPEKLQPVHNLLLLLISEIGFVGLTLLLIIIKTNIKRVNKQRFLVILAIVLITGIFDHYWWTLPQNKIIFLLATAIML